MGMILLEGKNFCVNRIDWSKDGTTMLLFDKVSNLITCLILQNELVIAYPPGEFLLRNPVEGGDEKFNDE